MDSGIEFKITQGLLRYLGFLIAITMYQAGIAIMARKKGDNSFETQKRATLNPFPHMEMIGTVLFPLITIIFNSPIVLGWPKPHYVETRRFKKPRRDINLVYLFGVGVNFIIAGVCMVALRFMGGGVFMFNAALDFSNPAILARVMLTIIGLTNMVIGALFLVPIPGTAGWNILINNVSYQWAQKLQSNMMMISVIGLMIIVLGGLNFYFSLFAWLFQLGSNVAVSF